MAMTDFLGLLGGLALFLYGMQMMSDGLEDAAGNRMKSILEKLTANRFLAVGVGAAITAVIQSSSATTVMVVGFVNSGIMTLNQAVWIIMGANIGTAVFTIVCSLFPLANFVEELTPGNPAAQIANMHTIFNICTTCLLLPFGNYMALAAEKIHPDLEEEKRSFHNNGVVFFFLFLEE